MLKSGIGRVKRLGGTLPAIACAAVMATTMLPATLRAEVPSARGAAIARSEIFDLLANTLLAFDDHDYTKFASSFSADGYFAVYDVDSKQYLRRLARADMQKFYANRPAPVNDAHHYTSNLTVDFQDKTHATLRGYYMTVYNRGSTNPPTPVGMGSYDSKVVKVDGKWKFLEYKAVRSAGDPANLRKPANSSD